MNYHNCTHKTFKLGVGGEEGEEGRGGGGGKGGEGEVTPQSLGHSGSLDLLPPLPPPPPLRNYGLLYVHVHNVDLVCTNRVHHFQSVM